MSTDPYAELDAGYGSGTIDDPYPRYRELRRRSAVVPGGLNELFGLPNRIQRPPDAPPVFSVLGYRAAAEVLRDSERFSSSVYTPLMGPVMGRTILEMDAGEHRSYRGVLQKAFSPAALECWERDLVRPVVDGCIDAFAERGHADLRSEFHFPFPVAVIAGMLGLPEGDLDDFHRWAVELISIGFDGERGLRASNELGRYFAPVVADRRRSPRDDLISVLAHAELDGTRLDDDEIVAFLRLLLPAGAETTFRSSANLVLGLLTHPDQLEALRRDRSLLDAAMEEALRWEPPLTAILRVATAETELAGVPIPAGALLGVNLGAANHDEDRYEDPERFDILRPRRQHLAFGFGGHRCLGMHLARIETHVAIDALLDRLPGLRLDPEGTDARVSGLFFRSPNRLPVRFDPAG